MPDWQPQVAPDLCSRCGAYWECEHQKAQEDEWMPGEYRITSARWGLLNDRALIRAAKELDAP